MSLALAMIALGYVAVGILTVLVMAYDTLNERWDFDLGGGWISNWVAYPLTIFLWPIFGFRAIK